MFDIGAIELLVLVIVAIIVIGPKEMPAALRLAGRWVGKIRRTSAQFRSGFDAMVREAEMEDMDKKWKEQNERIMAESPSPEMESSEVGDGYERSADDPNGGAESAEPRTPKKPDPSDDQPDLPLDPAKER